MADWAAIYERAEDRTSEMLARLVAEKKAQQIIKDSLHGTTTMSQDEKYDTRCDDRSAELNTGIPSQKQHNRQNRDLVERILPYKSSFTIANATKFSFCRRCQGVDNAKGDYR